MDAILRIDCRKSVSAVNDPVNDSFHKVWKSQARFDPAIALVW